MSHVAPQGGAPQTVTLLPVQRAMLDVIKFAEGTGTPESYKTWFGNVPFEDPTKLTIGQIKAAQDRFLKAGYGRFTDNTGRNLSSAAVGAYQMLAPEGRIGKTGLTLNSLFNQDTQDRLALEYMRAEAGVTPEMLQQQGFTRQISTMMGKPWASFPGSKHNQKTKEFSVLRDLYNKRLAYHQKATWPDRTLTTLNKKYPDVKPKPREVEIKKTPDIGDHFRNMLRMLDRGY